MGPSYFASWVVDETDQEEESDTARNEGYEKGTDGTKSTKEARVGQIILSVIYKCLEPGAKDTEIRGGWQSTGLCSSCVGKMKWDS